MVLAKIYKNIVYILLAKNANVYLIYKKYGYTLQTILWNGHKIIMQFLLVNTVDINFTNRKMVAVSKQHYSIIMRI